MAKLPFKLLNINFRCKYWEKTLWLIFYFYKKRQNFLKFFSPEQETSMQILSSIASPEQVSVPAVVSKHVRFLFWIPISHVTEQGLQSDHRPQSVAMVTVEKIRKIILCTGIWTYLINLFIIKIVNKAKERFCRISNAAN